MPNLTYDQAVQTIAEHGGYGKVRVYAYVYVDQGDGTFERQMVSVKSPIKADEYAAEGAQFFTLENDGTVPIRRA